MPYSDDEVALARAYLERGITPTATESRALMSAPAPAQSMQSLPFPAEAAPLPPVETLPTNMPDVGAGGTTAMSPEPGMFSGGTQGIPAAPVQAAPPPPIPAAPMPAPAPPPAMPGAMPPPVAPAGPPGIPRARGPAGPSGAIPGWLQKEMGSEIEGVIRRPPSPIVESITPEEQAQLGEAEDEAFRAGIEGQEAEQHAREADRRAVQAALDRQDTVEADIVRREQERQRELRTMEADYRAIADEIAATPIDSNRIWNSKNTGEKILSHITLAIATFGFGIAGEENHMLNKLEAEAERDLDAQKANKALQQSRLAAEGTLYGMARDRFASETAQDAVMREVQYSKIAQQLEQFRDFTKDPQRRAAMDQAVAEWNMKLSEAQMQRRQAVETDELQKRRLAALAAQQRRRDPMDALIEQRTKQAKLAGLERDIQGGAKPEDRAALTVPGRGIARDKDSAKAARDLEAANNELIGLLDEADRLSKAGATSGAFGVGTQNYQDAKALKARMIPIIGKINAGGFSPSETDMARADDMVPDPTSWRGSKFDAQQKALRTGARASVEARMKQYIDKPDPKAK